MMAAQHHRPALSAVSFNYYKTKERVENSMHGWTPYCLQQAVMFENWTFAVGFQCQKVSMK